MPWYCREWEQYALPMEMFPYGHMFTPLPVNFYSLPVYGSALFRGSERKKSECPVLELGLRWVVVKPLLKTSSVHGFIGFWGNGQYMDLFFVTRYRSMTALDVVLLPCGLNFWA